MRPNANKEVKQVISNCLLITNFGKNIKYLFWNKSRNKSSLILVLLLAMKWKISLDKNIYYYLTNKLSIVFNLME